MNVERLTEQDLIEWIDDAQGVHVDKAVACPCCGQRDPQRRDVISALLERMEVWVDRDGVLHRW